MNSTLQKLIISLIMIAILGFFGYKLFIAAPNATVAAAPQGETVGQDVLLLIDRLKNSTIDVSIFSGLLFDSLQDYSVPITPEPQGRTNPFAPIGAENGSQTTTAIKTVKN